ncbi:MAG: hypothetical protein PHQ98_03335 [Candidatus ainarchaeum sp.]|nr:hypothetical protein [Candidatus ainarchaeum sp.]
MNIVGLGGNGCYFVSNIKNSIAINDCVNSLYSCEGKTILCCDKAKLDGKNCSTLPPICPADSNQRNKLVSFINAKRNLKLDLFENQTNVLIFSLGGGFGSTVAQYITTHTNSKNIIIATYPKNNELKETQNANESLEDIKADLFIIFYLEDLLKKHTIQEIDEKIIGHIKNLNEEKINELQKQKKIEIKLFEDMIKN